MSSLPSIWLALMLHSYTIHTLNTWEKVNGTNGEDIWRSTSNFRPIQATSFGTIKLGQIMSVEFDFTFHGRSFLPRPGYKENFFRVGHSATDNGKCDDDDQRYPSMWLTSGIGPTGDLDISTINGSICAPQYTVERYEPLNIGIIHHIKVTLNNTMTIITITGGGKADYTQNWPRDPTLKQYLGIQVPIWFSTDHDTGTGSNVGNGTFSNIIITSQLFTIAPSMAPTTSPTTQTTTPSTTPTTTIPSSTPTTNVPSTTPTITTPNPITYNPTTSSPTHVGATLFPSKHPTLLPTNNPTTLSVSPSSHPTQNPTLKPTIDPTLDPTIDPTTNPTVNPSYPSVSPTELPSMLPSSNPSKSPTTKRPSYPDWWPYTTTTSSPFVNITIYIPIDSVDDDNGNEPFYAKYEYIEITIFSTVLALCFCTVFCFLAYLTFKRRLSNIQKKKNLEPPKYHRDKDGIPDQMAMISPRYSKTKSFSPYQSPKLKPFNDDKTNIAMVPSKSHGDTHKSYLKSPTSPGDRIKYHQPSLTPSKGSSHSSLNISVMNLNLTKDTTPTPNVSPNDRLSAHDPDIDIHNRMREPDDLLLQNEHQPHEAYHTNDEEYETYDKPPHNIDDRPTSARKKRRDKRRRKNTLDLEEYVPNAHDVDLEYAENDEEYEVVLDGYVDSMYTNARMMPHEGNALEDTQMDYKHHQHRRHGANRYEWIRETLQRVDSENYDGYLENFEKHRVEDHRLGDLLPEDWKELIPAIGPRNDFKRLWQQKYNANNTGTFDRHNDGESQYTDDIPEDLQSDLLEVLSDDLEDEDDMKTKIEPVPFIEDLETPHTMFDDEEDSSESDEDDDDEYYDEDEDDEDEVIVETVDTPYDNVMTPSETFDNDNDNEQMTFTQIRNRYTQKSKSKTMSKQRIEKQSVLSALSSAPSVQSSTESDSSYNVYNDSEPSLTNTQSQSIDEREEKEKEIDKEYKYKKVRTKKKKPKLKPKPKKKKRSKRVQPQIPPTLEEVEEPSHFSDDLDEDYNEEDHMIPITPLTPMDNKSSSSSTPPSPKQTKKNSSKYLMSPSIKSKHHNKHNNDIMPLKSPSHTSQTSADSNLSEISLTSAASGHTIMSDVSSNPPIPEECDPEELKSPLQEDDDHLDDYEDTVGIPRFQADVESEDDIDIDNDDDEDYNDNDNDDNDSEYEYEDEYADDDDDESISISQGLSDSGPEY